MKKYIFGMSLPHKSALKRLEADSEQFAVHVVKCIVYQEVRPLDVDHWIHELSTFLQDAVNVKCDSKLKPKDYRNTVLSYIGDDFEDAYTLLRYFQKHCCNNSKDNYPEFVIDDNLVDMTYLACNKLLKFVPSILASKEARYYDWTDLLKRALNSRR